jgi:hypothetical protein
VNLPGIHLKNLENGVYTMLPTFCLESISG